MKKFIQKTIAPLFLAILAVFFVASHALGYIYNPTTGGGGSGVSQIVAGTNISISPGGGTGVVTINSTGGSTTPGGLNTQLQYNNAGAFGGISGATTNGTLVSLNGAHLLNPTINGAGTGLATLAYPNTTASPTITFPEATGTLAISVNGITPDVNGNIVVPVATQDLQSVTDVGNTTTNEILSSVPLINNINTAFTTDQSLSSYAEIYTTDDGFGQFRTVDTSDGSYTQLNAHGIVFSPDGTGFQFVTGSSNIGVSGGLSISTANASNGIIRADNLTSLSTRNYQLPDADGTFALSVNGVAADSTGNITIPTGGTCPTGSAGQIQITDGTNCTTQNWLLDTNSNLLSGSLAASSATNSLAFGDSSAGGSINPAANSTLSFGVTTDTGSIIGAQGDGSQAFGTVFSGGQITSVQNGSLVFGSADTGGVINNNGGGAGTLLFGNASGGGQIGSAGGGSTLVFGDVGGSGLLEAQSDATQVFGVADSGGQIFSQGNGAEVSGLATNAAVISTTSNAARVFGIADGTNSLLSAEGEGSMVFGTVGGSGTITTAADNSLAFGAADGSASAASIQTDGIASMAFGVNTGGTIESDGNSSVTFGQVATLGSLVSSSANSMTFGNVSGDGAINSGNDSSLTFGISTGGSITTGGNGAQTFGLVDDTGNIAGGGDAALTFGLSQNASTIQGNNYSLTFGQATGTSSQVLGDGNANLTFGLAEGGGQVATNSSYSLAFGHASGTNSIIQTTNDDGFAFGTVTNGGQISTDGIGSQVFGVSNGSTGLIQTNDNGSIAHGDAEGGTIVAQNPGSTAFGIANGDDGNGHLSTIFSGNAISSAFGGQLAFGYTQDGALINAFGDGSQAFGVANGSDGAGDVSTIQSIANGGFAFGFADDGSVINAAGEGSQAFGYASGDSTSFITAQGNGAFAGGHVVNSGDSIQAAAQGSFAFGTDDLGQVIAGGSGSFALGSGIVNGANNSFLVGFGGDQIYAEQGGTVQLSSLNGSDIIFSSTGGIEFTSAGGWDVGGNFGAVGQVLTSQLGSAPIWSSAVPNVASNDTTGTGALSSVATFTAVDAGQFSINAYATITAVSLDVLQVQVTYTDETSTVRTQTFFPQGLTSANLATTGAFTFPSMDIFAKAGTAITVKTVLTTGTGSINYDVGATIQQIN